MPQYSSKCTCHMLHAFRGWPVHGNNSISQFYLSEVAMTDSLSRIHEELSLKGQKQMSHTSECSWRLLHALRGWHVHGKYESHNLSILYGKGGNKIFTILISSFASNCKNRKQIQANSSKYMIARTILPEDDDGREGVTGSGTCPLAVAGLWILPGRWRA